MGAAVQSATKSKSKGKVQYKLNKDDSAHEIESDVILVATGRKPNTHGLGLEALDIKLNDRGHIITNASWETTLPNIYAIGDVIEGPMLAHKAEVRAWQWQSKLPVKAVMSTIKLYQA